MLKAACWKATGAFVRGWRLGPEAWAVLGRSSRPSRGETEEESCSVGSCTSHRPRVPAHPWPAPLPPLRPRALLHASLPAASLASNPSNTECWASTGGSFCCTLPNYKTSKSTKHSHRLCQETSIRAFCPFSQGKKKKSPDDVIHVARDLCNWLHHFRTPPSPPSPPCVPPALSEG